MWAIHRIQSRNGDLAVFARDADGAPLPSGAAESVPRLVSERVGGAGAGAAVQRPLTGPELAREMEEMTASERLAEDIAGRQPPDRRLQYSLVLAAMRTSRDAVRFAAFDMPGAGWAVDSVVDQHIPME